MTGIDGRRAPPGHDGSSPKGSAMTPSETLDRGRAAFAEHRWGEAFDALADADETGALHAADLERMSTAAILLGRDAVGMDLATRAHEAFLGIEDAAGAARCATWIGIYLMGKGDDARAGGWLARAKRIAAEDPAAEPAEALLHVAAALDQLYSGAVPTAAATFATAFSLGRRFHDRDAMALAQLGEGQAKIMLDDLPGGLALLDEAMVAVTAGEISAVASGIVYCSVIGTCHLAFDVRRAQQWTIALDHWCGERPDMVMFSGQCQAHRAALYCFHGAWTDAMDAARVAQERAGVGDWSGRFGAWYEEGEVHRLRGEFDAAEVAFHRAGETGYPPQPGLALLRLAQGRVRLARSLIREAIEHVDPATRRQWLAAVVEIELAAGDRAAARAAADELDASTPADAMPMMRAVTARSDASVRLEEGDARGALARLRAAWTTWEELDAPYEAARCRVLAAQASRSLGDEASAAMDLAAARDVFAELGAVPDVLRVDGLARGSSASRGLPLTRREIEVVRLVAEGLTNRAIAGRLYLSEKTVDRHLSNVFAKLGISSRAAATAYAYEHALI
ncbi:LuxR C-terminal-related transcriptional regulator [Agromyces bauzanensis]